MEHVILQQLRAVESGLVYLESILPGLDQSKPENKIAPLAAQSMRATLGATIALLEAWGDGPCAVPEEAPQEPDDGICRHPENRRQSLSTIDGVRNWICRDCGFQPEGGNLA